MYWYDYLDEHPRAKRRIYKAIDAFCADNTADTSEFICEVQNIMNDYAWYRSIEKHERSAIVTEATDFGIAKAYGLIDMI